MRDVRDGLVVDVEPGVRVVGQPVGVRELGGEARRGEPHVAVERVGGEDVERGHPPLHAEPAHAAVDEAVRATGDAALLRLARLLGEELGVVDRLHAAAREERRAEADRQDQASGAVGGHERLGRAGRHVAAHDGAVRQRPLIGGGRAVGVRDRHPLHLAGPARVLAVAAAARGLDEERTDPVELAERALDERVAAVEPRLLVDGEAAHGRVGGILAHGRGTGRALAAARREHGARQRDPHFENDFHYQVQY